MIYILLYIIHYNINPLPRGGVEGYTPPHCMISKGGFVPSPDFYYFFCVVFFVTCKCLILISLESISKPLCVFLHKNLILVKYCYIGNFQ